MRQTVASAEEIARAFNSAWADHDLRPDVDVDVVAGSDAQPLFVFTIRLRLAEDFDTDDWPDAAVEELTSDLRNRIVNSPADDAAWYVTTAVKADTAVP